MAFEVGKTVQFANTFTGQTSFGQQIKRVPEKNPFRKKQLVRATIVLEPATFVKKAVVKVVEIYDDFMSAVCKIQEKYPGKKVSYNSVDLRPDWLKNQQKEREQSKSSEGLAEPPSSSTQPPVAAPGRIVTRPHAPKESSAEKGS